MVSLIITIIAIALVAALALATLYYGGEAYESGNAKAQTARLTNQGQQLLAAAELFYVQRGRWPSTIPEMVEHGYLNTIPVAQRQALQQALAAEEWTMPKAEQPLFTYDDVDLEVCKLVNEASYGLPGVLPTIQTGYVQQCFGLTKVDLVVVVGRSNLQAMVASVNEPPLVEENVSSDPIPAADDEAAWTVPPGGGTKGGGTGDTGGGQTVTRESLGLSVTNSYGAVATNTSSNLDIELTNSTSNSIALTAPAVSGDTAFSVNSTTCGPSLAAGASCVVTVRYAPSTVTASASTTLTVAPGVTTELTATSYNPVSLQSSALPPGKLNKPYTPVAFSDFLSVSNESTPDFGQVVWGLQGTLPAGLTFENGVLSGTPTAVTDSSGQSFSVLATYKSNEGQQTYVLRVGDAVLEALQVVTGQQFSCALTPVGGVKCWGIGGALGDGGTTRQIVPVDVVGLTSGVVKVAAGNLHACAVTSGGALKCWGINANGQLGDGTTTSRREPVDVSGLSSGVLDVTLGGAHSCALLSGGAVQCWGQNSWSQLGNGNTTGSSIPVNVSGLSSGVVSFDSGTSHTCAILSTGGLKCWGYNAYNQLGDGTMTNRSTPVDVPTLESGVVQVSGGHQHTCAVTAAGAAKCWGNGYYGQVGNGGQYGAVTPDDVSGLSAGVLQVATGTAHSCAVLSTGALKCWGQNHIGQVGDGSGINRLLPVDVLGLSGGVTAVTSYGQHSCARTSGGQVKCWGWNDNGQLGDQTLTNRWAPVNVKD